MQSGANVFEISNIQEAKREPSQPGDRDVTMLRCVENGWMEFLRSTAQLGLQVTPAHA
jgi:hypothetical protein